MWDCCGRPSALLLINPQISIANSIYRYSAHQNTFSLLLSLSQDYNRTYYVLDCKPSGFPC